MEVQWWSERFPGQASPNSASAKCQQQTSLPGNSLPKPCRNNKSEIMRSGFKKDYSRILFPANLTVFFEIALCKLSFMVFSFI